MAGNGINKPSLEGILKWSLAQSDGTSAPRQISEDERRWFSEAMGSITVDIVKRMKEISAVMGIPEDHLLQQGVTVDELEGMLDELQEHVESIDMANDLKAVGGLEPLLRYLKSEHAGLRARAAEVVSTMVQNNPKSQQHVLEAGGLLLLLDNFMTDDDVASRTKALGAVSSLIRQNSEATASFLSICGVNGLQSALSVDNHRLQRKGILLLQYILEEDALQRKEAMADMSLVSTITTMVSSSDSDVRIAALQALLLLVPAHGSLNRDSSSAGPSTLVPDDLKGILSRRIEAIGELDGEDREAAADEKNALYSLWTKCFVGSETMREGSPHSIDDRREIAYSVDARGGSDGRAFLLGAP